MPDSGASHRGSSVDHPSVDLFLDVLELCMVGGSYLGSTVVAETFGPPCSDWDPLRKLHSHDALPA